MIPKIAAMPDDAAERRTAVAWAIIRAMTPENKAELEHYGNAGPIADAILAALATNAPELALGVDATAIGTEARRAETLAAPFTTARAGTASPNPLIQQLNTAEHRGN